jgi:hypothetical protein
MTTTTGPFDRITYITPDLEPSSVAGLAARPSL